jgi:hypothetical protein
MDDWQFSNIANMKKEKEKKALVGSLNQTKTNQTTNG